MLSRLLPALLLSLWQMAVATEPPIAIAIHGGAGTMRPSDLDEDTERDVRQTLERAARSGYRVLAEGGTSLDAVQAAVMVLEDSPLFNAGKGAVFNHEGENELDAAIMNGANLQAGAVAGLRTIRNPILAARAVMEHSPHVLLFGQGAEQFARSRELEQVDPGYFHTERRWRQLEEAREQSKQFGLGKSAALRAPAANPGAGRDSVYSTVGAVALDRHGNLAAATSTGGLTNKRFGRVGDVPVLGAGTYANNESCAVSATGHGEYFIRSVVAFDICALVQYRGLSLAAAAEEVVMNKLVARGGSGGVIAVDTGGNLALTFNTRGMYRAAVDRDGHLTVGIYAGSDLETKP